eukprot:6197411-Pleurochrysis_carterae.AAC.2
MEADAAGALPDMASTVAASANGSGGAAAGLVATGAAGACGAAVDALIREVLLQVRLQASIALATRRVECILYAMTELFSVPACSTERGGTTDIFHHGSNAVKWAVDNEMEVPGHVLT